MVIRCTRRPVRLRPLRLTSTIPGTHPQGHRLSMYLPRVNILPPARLVDDRRLLLLCNLPVRASIPDRQAVHTCLGLPRTDTHQLLRSALAVKVIRSHQHTNKVSYRQVLSIGISTAQQGHINETPETAMHQQEAQYHLQSVCQHLMDPHHTCQASRTCRHRLYRRQAQGAIHTRNNNNNNHNIHSR